MPGWHLAQGILTHTMLGWSTALAGLCWRLCVPQFPWQVAESALLWIIPVLGAGDAPGKFQGS